MSESSHPHPDWDPSMLAAREDDRVALDEMRRRCPVAYSDALGWSVFQHADVERVLHDHETFSNVVSQRRSVPNGMDPPEHTSYRSAIEPYFTDARMRAFEPVCRQIAGALLDSFAAGATLDYIEAFALPFAVHSQCAFLGWPDALVEPLTHWARRNREATQTGNQTAIAELARELRGYVDAQLQARRHGEDVDDITAMLMRAQVAGRPLTDEELASILRNWTVGEVGSLSAGAGIVAHQLAADQALQKRLRAEPSLLPAALDELLRISGPLSFNRRVATREVVLGGRRIAAGARISVMWIAANRDEQVFACPSEVRFDRDPQLNLLYGVGIHACPGAPLARLELRVAIELLLERFGRVDLADEPARRAAYPATGWLCLPLRLA
jgi:cytochrome P450